MLIFADRIAILRRVPLQDRCPSRLLRLPTPHSFHSYSPCHPRLNPSIAHTGLRPTQSPTRTLRLRTLDITPFGSNKLQLETRHVRRILPRTKHPRWWVLLYTMVRSRAPSFRLLRTNGREPSGASAVLPPDLERSQTAIRDLPNPPVSPSSSRSSSSYFISHDRYETGHNSSRGVQAMQVDERGRESVQPHLPEHLGSTAPTNSMGRDDGAEADHGHGIPSTAIVQSTNAIPPPNKNLSTDGPGFSVRHTSQSPGVPAYSVEQFIAVPPPTSPHITSPERLLPLQFPATTTTGRAEVFPATLLHQGFTKSGFQRPFLPDLSAQQQDHSQLTTTLASPFTATATTADNGPIWPNGWPVPSGVSPDTFSDQTNSFGYTTDAEPRLPEESATSSFQQRVPTQSSTWGNWRAGSVLQPSANTIPALPCLDLDEIPTGDREHALQLLIEACNASQLPSPTIEQNPGGATPLPHDPTSSRKHVHSL